MYQVDFNKPIHIHFIGIGGISMSGLAEILMGRGFSVSGSDAKESALTDHLKELGATIYIGQTKENIKPGIDLVVYTAAIHPDNPEFKAAQDAKLPMLTRAELLGEIMKNYEVPIAVAGTHGKTTTTSMASHVLMKADLDPTITVGGILPAIHGNIRVGQSQNFIAEACEYTNSFLSFSPKIELILNVDADHLDFFKDLDDIANSFHKFAKLLPSDGTLIIDRDTQKFDTVVEGVDAEIITYSMTQDADYTAKDITFDQKGCGSFIAYERGNELGRFTLNVPGKHNVSNALSSIALGRKLGIEYEVISQGLLDFKGTERRFEYKGMYGGFTVIDDYAHHPTEIEATITAAKNYPHKELWVCFQPHTYTRTKALLPEFAEALAGSDHIILADIYAAREKNTVGVSSEDLRKLISEKGTDAIFLPTFDEIEAYLKSHVKPGDLLITMGAGNVVEIGENLLNQ